MKHAALAAVLVLLAPVAQAADLLVPTQYATIQAAADVAAAGDTVLVADGTYAPFTVKNSGAEGARIVFQAQNQHGAVIDGDLNPTHQSGNCIFANRISHLEILDFAVTNCGKSAIWIEGGATAGDPARGIRVAGNHVSWTESMGVAVAGNLFSNMIPEGEVRLYDVVVEDNEVTKTNEPDGNNEAISVGNGVSHVLIRNNHVHHSRQYGIDCKIGCYNVAIYGNDIHDMVGRGVYLDSRNERVLVYDNFIHDNGGDGIVLMREEPGDMDNIHVFNNLVVNNDFGILVHRHPDDAGDSGWGDFRRVFIVNNTFADNRNDGAQISSTWLDVPTEFDFTNNLFWNNAGVDLDIGIPSQRVNLDSNLTGTDPLFVDGYHLSSSSPAIDAGASSLAARFDIDYYGVIRAMCGAAPDIGAIEHCGGP